MAQYLGSDKTWHKANIIGLLPSNDYGTECTFARCIPTFNFEGLFDQWEEWKNNDIIRTIYVQYTVNYENIPTALGMTVQFDNNREHNIKLSQTELDYLTSCLILFLAKPTLGINEFDNYDM